MEDQGSTSISEATPVKRIVRISKACENCRVRRIRCEPPYPCKACRESNRDDCQVRSKPRPGRTSKEVDASRLILGTSLQERTNALGRIEGVLEEWMSSTSGETLSLALEEDLTHPALDLSYRIEHFPDFGPDCQPALDAFLKHSIPFCAYISSARIQHLFERSLSPISDLTPDQTALVCVCLAIGYVRLEYFGESRHAVQVAENQRTDVFWFRRAVHLLENWGDATFTSLHAIAAMWFYTSLVGPSRLNRFVITWMISQARDLNINRDFSETLRSPADRPEAIIAVVVYSHFLYYSTGPQTPLILQDEFIIPVIPRRDIDKDNWSLRGLTYSLLSLNNDFLRELADGSIRDLPIEWLLDVESKWARWEANRLEEAREYGSRPVDTFMRISWFWGQIFIRSTAMDDSRFQISGCAMLSRAAVEIINTYNEIYTSSPYNLAWQHLRHLSTCAHVLLFCVLKARLSPIEASPPINSSLSLIALSIPRWGNQSKKAIYNIEKLARALHVPLDLGYPAIDPAAPPFIDWNPEDFFGNANLDFDIQALDKILDGQAQIHTSIQ